MMAFSKDDLTNAVTTDSITSLVYDFDNTAEWQLLSFSDSSENNSEIGIETDIPNILDDFFEDDLFRSEPRNYTPEFRKEIDEVTTSEYTILPIMTKEATQSSISKSLPHLTTDSLQLSNPNLNMIDKQEEPRGLNHYFRQDSIFHLNSETGNKNKTGNEVSHVNKKYNCQRNVPEDSDNDSDRFAIGDDTHPNPCLICQDIPSANDIYIRKLRELELEVNEIERLLWDKNTEGILANTEKKCRKLSSQRSVSESDISDLVNCRDIHLSQYGDEVLSIEKDKFKMEKSSSTEGIQIKTLCNRIKHDVVGITKHPSLKNITLGARKLRSNIKDTRGKPDENNTKSYEPPKKLEIKVDGHVILSCPCEGSCRRVGRVVTTHGGYTWVSFTKCSWVILYNHQHVKVFMLDTRGGYVDSLAVSKSGNLYITCPPKRRILMLSTNLELTVLGVFNSLYPRGLAVSPEDETVVVCMVPHLEGLDMDVPTKDSCLMRFTGQKPNESGTIVNMDSYFGYPMKVVINVNGVLLVSDFGLKCLFVLDKGGHMLRTFSVLGGVDLSQVHALSCNPGKSFFVVQGGSGILSITEVVDDDRGIFEKSTSKKYIESIKRNIVTSSMVNTRQIVFASGSAIVYVSLV